MISIIICSINSENAIRVRKNIELTIGVPYQIILIDNSVNNRPLCEVYNRAIPEAEYDIVCLLHEDLLVKTIGWGKVIQKCFLNPEIGLLGVAGAYYYSMPPISWYGTEEKEENVLMNARPGIDPPELLHHTRFPENKLTEVIVADGVFMVLRKKIFDTISFDEQLLKHFHGYDMDLSLQVLQTHKIFVTKEIFIEHFSKGTHDKNWFEALRKVADKWEKKLPVYLPFYSKQDIKKLNSVALLEFYLLASPYLSRRTRISLYFYYAAKQDLLFVSFKQIIKFYINRFFKSK